MLQGSGPLFNLFTLSVSLSLSDSEVFGAPALKDLWFTLAGANMFRDHLDAYDPKQKDDIKKILLSGLIV